MKKDKTHIESIARETVKSFLNENLGERPGETYSAFINNALAICLTDVLSPAEEHFALSKGNMENIQRFKAREFEIVKNRMIKELHHATGWKISDINSFITGNGERFLVIYFNISKSTGVKSRNKMKMKIEESEVKR